MKMLIGGSPCTFWSIAQTKNRETEPKGLGWELFKNYLIARDKFKPDYFLYENNKSMAAAIRERIIWEFGFEPVCLNSSLVSAQNRQRLYWIGKREPDGTYTPLFISPPEDEGILLQDVLDTGAAWHEKGYALQTAHGVSPEYVAQPAVAYAGRQVGRRINEQGRRDDYNGDLEHIQRFEVNDNPAKTNCLTTVTKDNMVAEPLRIGTVENNAANPSHDSKQYRVYSPDAKSTALCGGGGGMGAVTGLYATPCGDCENCKAAGKPVYRVEGGLITIRGRAYPIKLKDGCYIIRKLTVAECKRLQPSRIALFSR